MSASSGHKYFPIDTFARSEWYRLNDLFNLVSSQMIVSINRYLAQGNDKFIRTAVDNAVVSIGAKSAVVYGVSFKARDYIELSDKIADDLIKIISPPNVRHAVQRILPRKLPLTHRIERLKTDGLDLKTAIKIERWRQGNPEMTTKAREMVVDARNRRINLIVRTEVPRIAMRVLDKLWADNLAPEEEVVKVDRPRMVSDLAISGGIIPRNARKYWVTRRDGKVCQYCDPLEGLTTKVGTDFDTPYGIFSGPPIHPQCRCVAVLSARGRRP